MPILLNDIFALSPNRLALGLVRRLLDHPEAFRIEQQEIEGATVIDCGVHAAGGWEAGLMLARICLGGLARVRMHWGDFAGLRWPAVEVGTDHPVRACMAAQYAGWFVKKDKFSAMGSGPARAVVCAEELFARLNYRDSSPQAVLCLESGKLPTREAVRWIVEKCGLKAEDVYILVAPTASPAGSVQIAARAVETGLHKLMELGYDIGLVESGWGIAPLPPVAADDLSAIGRTNDAVLYGSTVWYHLRDEDQVLQELVKKVPSATSRDYGLPFQELFARYGNFYDIDPLLFSPAEVWLNNIKSGATFHGGEVRPDLLKKSFHLAS